MKDTAKTENGLGDVDIAAMMTGIGARAKKASAALAIAPPEVKALPLEAAADAVWAKRSVIIAANQKDLEYGRAKNLSAAGLKIKRVRTPLGVIGVIYESRPNVTADAGALCLKAGNAVILRGGSESFHSSAAIHSCLLEGLRVAGLPEAAVQLVPTRDRAAVQQLLTMTDSVDVIVPRGGKGLVGLVQREARVPVFAHLEGIVHIYIDKAADVANTMRVVLNSKL